MMYIKTFRPAIAMIELIFAIIVMGIVMMSAPMLISTATKSGYVAIQQEGINEAATQMNIIMGYPWDENNADLALTPMILRTNPVSAGLGPNLFPNRRDGTPQSSERMFIEGTGTTRNASAPPLGSDAGDRDDIDDFNGLINLRSIQAAGASDYIQKAAAVNIRSNIAYMSDAVAGGYNVATLTFTPFVASPAADTSNIKRIQVTVTSADVGTTNEVTELAKTIVLRAFSCNIGSYELEER